MSTVNKALLGALILQVLLLLGTSLGGSKRMQIAATQEIFPGLDPEKVTAVEIYGPSEDGDGQESVKLSRKGDGWVVGGTDDFPAKGSEVERLLGTLSGLKSRNQVLTGSIYHKKLKVSEEAYRRKLVLSMGDEQLVAFLGTSPSFKNIHIRREDQDAVFQVPELSESDAGARAWSWVDRTYVKVPKEELWSLTLKNEHGTLQLDRDPSSDTWAVLGVNKPLKKTEVDGLVADARDLGLEEPVGKTEKPEYELGKGATLTLVTGTSTIASAPPEKTETLTVRIGKKLENKDRRYVKASNSDYVVLAAGWEVRKLLETKKDDLIEEEEKDEDSSDNDDK